MSSRLSSVPMDPQAAASSQHGRDRSIGSAETASASSLTALLQRGDSPAPPGSSPVKRPAASVMDIDDPAQKRQKLALPTLLDPIWRSNASRASSPANSVYSESHESSSGKGGSSRPATFLYTLCQFLNSHPHSPYMRWAEDGSYFLILDKDGLMRDIIPQMFSQNSYSSFARQLNIYGWRRLQTSPDGKVTNANCTIWKHDDIFRNCPEDRIKNVKRNATDKTRRVSKTSRDSEETGAAQRARASLVSTTIAQALASRPRAESAPDRQRIASLTIKGPRYPQQGVFHDMAAVEMRPIKNLPARSAISDNMLATTAGQLSLQNRSKQVPHAWASTATKPAVAAAQVAVTKTASHQRMSSIETTSDYATPTRQADYQILQPMPAPQASVQPSNPVDIFIACLKHEQAPPGIVARDRLDIPVWIDPLTNLRFVLAGDLMRSWVVWDVFPSKALLFVMSADAKVPPRPLGAPKALRSNSTNGDPKVAVSRERIYLDAPAEPGSIGQCCLVFRSSAPSMQTLATEELPTLQKAYQTSTDQPVRQPVLPLRIGQIRQGSQPASQSPIFPATPLQSGPRPISAERRGPAIANLPASGPASSLPVAPPTRPSPPIEMEPQTPHTADAVSSLALMQSLSRRLSAFQISMRVFRSNTMRVQRISSRKPPSK